VLSRVPDVAISVPDRQQLAAWHRIHQSRSRRDHHSVSPSRSPRAQRELITPLLAEELGGGEGSLGGDLFLAIISAVAFATILAVVAGLIIAATGAVAHDVWTGVIRHGRGDEREEVRVARIASVSLGSVAILASILAGETFNVGTLVGLAFAVAASANMPALVMVLFWPRFNTTGAIAGVLGGLLVSLIVIALSPAVWPGPDSEGSPIRLSNLAIISIPAGFLACWLGTMLSHERGSERTYHELHVRAETGIGAA
jgi:cation/acetate symporter